LSGHFPVEIGRVMEDSFIGLLYRLGYTVSRGTDFESKLDIIGKFYGHPINPNLPHMCTLLPPFFAPIGTTAFSVKRGNFGAKDVKELIDKVQKAKSSKNETLKSLEGMIIVTNFIRTEKDLDALLSKNVYCWDGRRLIFYSAKARAIQELTSRSSVQEIAIEGVNNSSYLIEIETETSEELKNVISTNIVVFIDDHNKDLIISGDHIERMLEYIYKKSLGPIVDSTQMDVRVLLEIHALGVVHESIVKNSYNKYVKESSLHPQVFFSAEPSIFQYGSAPWVIVYSAKSSINRRA